MSEPAGNGSTDVVVVTAAVAAVGSVAAMLPLRSWDYWYHLAVGRLIAVRQALPSTNIFGFSAEPTEPVFVHTWIGDQWLFHLHELGGLVAALAGRNLCAIAAFGLVAWAGFAVSGRNALSTACLTLVSGLSFMAVSGFAGPQMFAWPLFGMLGALCVALLERGKWLPLLPIVFGATTALWANLAPNFWIPAVMAAAFAVAAKWREESSTAAWFAAAVVAATVAPLATPLGPGIAAGLLDFNHVEAWLFLAGPIALGPAVASLLPPRRRALPRWQALAMTITLIGAMLALQPWSDTHRAIPAAVFGESVRQTDPLRGYGPSLMPVEAVELMRSWGSQPRVYAEPHLSGYLLYELQDPAAPLPIVWPVPDHVPTDHVAQLEIAVETQPEVFRGVFKQYRVDAVLITPELAPLGGWLQDAADWEKIGTWPTGSLFVPTRRSEPAAE